MDLILWRHAEAEEGWNDLQRALTPKGRRQAEKMAKWLSRQLRGKSLRLIASGALRSQQTLAALSQDYRIETRLNPGASPTEYLNICTGQDGETDVVIVVGHQPEIGRVAGYLLTGRDTEWAVKKGAVWWLRPRRKLEAGSSYALRAMVTPQML